MTTPTQPADLLAPLLALVAKWREQASRSSIGGDHMDAVEGQTLQYCADELQAAIESLAAHRGEAVGEVVRSSPEVMIGRIYDQTRVRTGDKLYLHPLQAHRGEVAEPNVIVGSVAYRIFYLPNKDALPAGTKLYLHPPEVKTVDPYAWAPSNPSNGLDWAHIRTSRTPYFDTPVYLHPPQAQAGAGDARMIGEAVARGWCSPENAHKAVDPALAHAITLEVLAALEAKP